MSEEHPQIHIEGKLGGLIQYCSSCQRVSVRYCHLLMPMSLSQFSEFVKFVETSCESHFKQNEEVELQLRFGEVYLCLLDDEAQDLLELVREAEIEICRFRLEQSYGLVAGS